MYQRQGAIAYKADLHNTVLLCNHLHNPQNALKCIHVAGTNGKGSVSHMLASILQEAGYKVGLYTSPHLIDFRERIKIYGGMISEDYIVDFFKHHRPFFESNQLSFFEMTVGLAFEYFNFHNVDIAVIEVGMGGRLDSTNIINPILSVITTIGFDHTQFLGNTLPLIAFEKAGIIKENIPVVIGEYNEETKPVFVNQALNKKSPIYFAYESDEEAFECALKGDYQKNNIKTVLQSIKVLQGQKHYLISEKQIKNGLLNVIENTGLMGRWQLLRQNPLVICDTAHNKQGLEIALNQLQKQKYNRLFFVLGVVNDKDLSEILPLFPKNAFYFYSKPNLPRGLSAQILFEKATENELIGEVCDSVSDAYQKSLFKATKDDLIYVGGSTFVVAEVLSFLACKQ